ncbi:ultraviolet-B receptor UVR8 isoform X3 [Cannabis sativa]|uniref:ultraviolet-B receptor UVR8 isoform X3 n=1 Tax=Cannabis sativa TaxID=3483 RepID=UPI0011DFEBDB|nr:ultraviolet-B receptor UVR8 isoform X3 [Cannabis sativa]
MKETDDDEAKLSCREEEQEKQEIWSWGAGTDGQLGTGNLQDELSPQLLKLPSLFSARPISHLACGGAHVIALTSEGKVLTWGRGASGQLGHGDMLNNPNPKLVNILESYCITHVSAGWNHSGFVSDCGSVFTCGDGSFGQLGHGHSGDQIYAFGSGKRGQLGISKDKVKSVSLPEVTCGLDGINIVSIAANGDHSAALSNDGKLYTWGRGFQGKSDAYYPEHLTTSFCSTKATLGWNHALLLTGNGEACILGGNRHGVLSRPDKVSALENMQDSNDLLEEVPGLDGEKVVDIAAGSEHSALITEKGVVKTWGWGEHGQLGLGNTVDQTSPQPVTLYNEVPTEAVTSKVYCGSGFTIVIRTKDAPLPPRCK